jgi:hypothetical protein
LKIFVNWVSIFEIYFLFVFKVAQLLQLKEDKEHELNLLRSKPIKEMWRQNLDDLEAVTRMRSTPHA